MRLFITPARLVPTAFAGVLVFGAGFQGPVDAASIAISCGAVGQELNVCREGAQAWARQTGNEVKLVSTPASGSERLALYLPAPLRRVRRRRRTTDRRDIWPGILASHLLDLGPYAGSAVHDHFPAMIENNTVEKRLVALPWFVDVGLLYYRKDLLQKYGADVPQTWEELERHGQVHSSEERAAGHRRMWGFVWQGRAYEGLTCNALEWIASQDGGTILDAAGHITIANASAAHALTLAAAWVGTITPEGVLNYAEEEARGIFQAGDAVFMRNWPYAWALVTDADSAVRGKVGVAQLPRGPSGRRAATLGGQQLAVSRYSHHAELATQLVVYLTSRDEQKRRAQVGRLQSNYSGAVSRR